SSLLHPRALVANASKFPESFRELAAVSGDTRNRHYSRVNGWNTPKWEYRRARQSNRETIEEI
ncbi:MAG TPA: hypothetical protein VEX18_06775, partial [Polyangiaceae bacterium]|nr:hypothetical protein [Polyangiaceae bacterium]